MVNGKVFIRFMIGVVAIGIAIVAIQFSWLSRWAGIDAVRMLAILLIAVPTLAVLLRVTLPDSFERLADGLAGAMAILAALMVAIWTAFDTNFDWAIVALALVGTLVVAFALWSVYLRIRGRTPRQGSGDSA